MSAGHRAVIEMGPGTVHRLCCGAVESTLATAALEWIDESFGLLEGHPVPVRDLLRDVLSCPQPADSLEVIHPSWWPARRVALVTGAAPAQDVTARPRAELLFDGFGAEMVVEVATALVAVTTATEVSAEPRLGAPDQVADAVARRVAATVRGRGGGVVIDAPIGVGGAAALAEMIERRLRPQLPVTVSAALPPVACAADPPATAADPPATAADPPATAGGRAGRRLRLLPMAAAVGLAIPVALGVVAHRPPQTADPARYLVEGRVAVQVPADWLVRRAAGGPGSARVEVVSPADPQLALHITQAPAVSDALAGVAEPLRRGLLRADADSPGVFVGFDAAGASAGRPAVTYRELRSGRQIDWAVVVDGAVRIGIGCQSGPGGENAVRQVCEQAVRSARAVS
ncbi:type VII secretion-associated protein [Mycolicibacter minnesotensis]